MKWLYDIDRGTFSAGTTDTPTKPPPKPGDLSIVANGSDEPVCIIETPEVRNRIDEIANCLLGMTSHSYRLGALGE